MFLPLFTILIIYFFSGIVTIACYYTTYKANVTLFIRYLEVKCCSPTIIF